MNGKRLMGLTLFLTLCFYGFANTGLHLPAIFGDHMVLQQNSDVNIWGWANPRSKVSIVTEWNNDTVVVESNEKAKWLTTIKTPEAGGSYRIHVFVKDTKITIEDVLIGELWLCSGQSNMEWNAARGVTDAQEELGKELNRQLRFFSVDKSASEYPQDDLKGYWRVCDAESLKWFSAVGYFFGKNLHDKLQVPVGLINSSWGGTVAETWVPSEFIPEHSLLFEQAKKLSRSNSWDITTGATYNAMIHPFINMTIKGVIWYQGESNTANANTYSVLMEALVSGWRSKFQSDLPFYYVQIAPYLRYQVPHSAAVVREQQEKAMRLIENTGMIVVSDRVDDLNDIHPRYKGEVGARLARYALAETYKQDVGKYKFVTYRDKKVEKKGVRIYFNHTDNQPLNFDGKVIEGLEVAGEDLQFYPASGKIDKKTNTLFVFSNQVSKPQHVRYSFGNGATGNLFDYAGLPVAPFRTDDEWFDF